LNEENTFILLVKISEEIDKYNGENVSNSKGKEKW